MVSDYKVSINNSTTGRYQQTNKMNIIHILYILTIFVAPATTAAANIASPNAPSQHNTNVNFEDDISSWVTRSHNLLRNRNNIRHPSLRAAPTSNSKVEEKKQEQQQQQVKLTTNNYSQHRHLYPTPVAQTAMVEHEYYTEEEEDHHVSSNLLRTTHNLISQQQQQQPRNSRTLQATLELTDGADLKNLNECEGDCDVDSDCIGDLKCYFRFSDEPVPNCLGNGVNKRDYCAYKTSNYLWYISNAAEPDSLGECEGDCDNDAQVRIYCSAR